MRFRVRTMRWKEARVVSQWHYDGPYAFYDMHLFPVLIIQQILKMIGFPMYYSVFTEDGEFVGLFSFKKHTDIVDIGLGLRPDLVGKGIGLEFLLAGLEFARACFFPAYFRLIVAMFNRRAIKVYEKADFQPVKVFRYGAYEFLEMMRKA